MSRPSTSFTEPPRLPRIVPGLVRVRKRRDVPRVIAWIALAVALVESAGLLYPNARALALSLEETPAVRGQRLADSLGCFSCHGPAACPPSHRTSHADGTASEADRADATAFATAHTHACCLASKYT